MMPAIMDSQGKPGIAGNTIGVETELVTEVLVVVGVLATVIVDIEVLTIVVMDELVVDDVMDELVVDDVMDELVVDDVIAVTGVGDVELIELLTVETTVTVLVVGVDVVTCATTGGFRGSKWNIPARDTGTLVIPAPTAQPSCGFVRETERSPRPGEGTTRGGERGTTVHEAPS